MFVIVRAITYALLFVGLVLMWAPGYVLEQAGITPPEIFGWAQGLGAALVVVGGLLAGWCVITFARVGRGTPAPFDPPRRLVTEGPYQYARNPMYWGAGLALVGIALYFRSWAVVKYGAILLIFVYVFVLVYEEPTLRRLFGKDYEEYCRRVPRWLPVKRPPTD
jgi:protein-S-isoprenylcysteine O-methyltransferase Ste14